jgi:hypothetical protein
MPISKRGDSVPLQGAVVGLASRLSRTYIADLGIYMGNSATMGLVRLSPAHSAPLFAVLGHTDYLSRPVSYPLQDRFPAVSFAQRSDVTQE